VSSVSARPLDLRGKTISTYILFGVVEQRDRLREGDSLTILTDRDEALDNDLKAWCRATGTELRRSKPEGIHQRYEFVFGPRVPREMSLAMVISDPGLERLLSPLGFALAAALEDIEVHLYIQGPAVKVLTRGFREKLPGLKRPFSRLARDGLARAGHLPAQNKLRQLRTLGGHIYLCGPSMQHFRVQKEKLIFDDVPIVEYATFMRVMKDADIHLFLQ
jgi:predicted peroxiredoxin